MRRQGVRQRYASLARELTRTRRVAQPVGKKGFGSSGLYVGGKLFAFVSYKDRLIVKLPAGRVEELIAQGEGAHWNPRSSGRALREWFVLRSSSGLAWSGLAREAMEFVASPTRGRSP